MSKNFNEFLYLIVILMSIIKSSSSDENYRMFNKLGVYEYWDSHSQTGYVSTYYDSQNLKLFWNDAFIFCKAFGMELAIFETQEEQDYVLDMLQKNWRQNLDTFTSIGGTRIGSKDLSDWYWAATGRKINYPLRWNRGQPDNAQGVEHCLTIMREEPDRLTINDAECSTKEVVPEMKFICEKTKKRDEYCGECCVNRKFR